MPPAARVGDTTSHGTPLSPGIGSPNVSIGGAPAWRAGLDTHICPQSDVRLRAGKVLRLEGLGEQFSGLYRLTSATHTLDGSGYRTSFEARKEIWFGSIPLVEQGAVRVNLQGQSQTVR